MLTFDYLPNIGGIASHVYFLARAIQREGHSVTVVNPSPNLNRPTARRNEGGVQTLRVHYNAGRWWPLNVLRRHRATMEAVESLDRTDGPFDVVHQHDFRQSLLTAHRLRTRHAWIWTNHSSEFLRYFASAARRAATQLAFGGVHGVIGVSHELYEASVGLWGKRAMISYIPNGVDTVLFSPEVADERRRLDISTSAFVVLCPRRMVEKNGVIYLVEAAEYLLQRAPDVEWKFVFLGSEVESDPVYTRSVLQRLEPLVRAGVALSLGNVSPSRMPAMNATADVVVVPSLVEAVSLSALEAMATRRPVIASRVGGLPEIVTHRETGMLVEPRDAGGLANAILQLQRDQGLRDRTAAAGCLVANGSYSWSSVAKRTLSFYEQVVTSLKAR